ncbi:MAG TPA: hypothetical protein VFA52_00580 [Candidatus Paceibacterota bacterium]|nr:hypothetical protein [Candidatus Paceibacterota bacterium]
MNNWGTIFQETHLVITDNATSKLLADWRKLYGVLHPDPVLQIKRFLRNPALEKLPARYQDRRQASNGQVKADYYRFGEWRLVIIKDEEAKTSTVVTVEAVPDISHLRRRRRRWRRRPKGKRPRRRRG